MFKRPKEDSSADQSESAAQTAQPPSPTYQNTEKPRQGEVDSSSRIVTPAYEVRRPTVRTLQNNNMSPSSSTGPSSTGSTSAAPGPANLHVGRGLKLEGKIQSCDVLVIEGDVQATIESGTLNITETGDVRGEATVDQAEINGKFDGTLIVRKCLSINASGRVTGTIRYGELKIEQGGKLSGEVEASEAGSSPTTARPALKPDISSSPSALV